MARFVIAEYCKQSQLTRADGAQLRTLIEEHWEDAEPIVLDFYGLRIASVSFFDESLGLLAKRYPLDELGRRLRMENINAADRVLLNGIVSSRAKEREGASDDGHQAPV